MLLLPSDLLLADLDRVHLRICSPKSQYRGGALVQHITLIGSDVVRFLAAAFGSLSHTSPLYPFSDSGFRKRWDYVLQLLHVSHVGFTPGGLRGGGAVRLYMSDVAISTIMWRMRLSAQRSLEHYLQEVAATQSLSAVSCVGRSNLITAAKYYDLIMRTV